MRIPTATGSLMRIWKRISLATWHLNHLHGDKGPLPLKTFLHGERGLVNPRVRACRALSLSATETLQGPLEEGRDGRVILLPTIAIPSQHNTDDDTTHQQHE